MSTPFEYAKAHEADFIEELKTFLRIPSISGTPSYSGEVRRTAEWLRDHCLAIGLTHAEVVETAGHPVVYAEWLGAGEDAPTVLVYGHYDVQPVDDPRNEWQSDPFEPVIRDGNLYARGATDDKGQTFIHLKAFESYMKTEGRFPINFKIMMEGEEECGSANLTPFIHQYLDRLGCDAVVISDSEIFDIDRPMMLYGLRGLVYTEIEIKGQAGDLHSGAFGGAVYNPAQAMAELLAKMHDSEGRITIPGFYDDVVELTPAERETLAQSPENDETLYRQAGVKQGWGEAGYSAVERVGARPTLEINGMIAGFTEKGGQKTVIGPDALAKVSCRLVPNQDPDKIFGLLKDFIAANLPPQISFEIRQLGGSAPGILIPIDSEPMQIAANAYQTVFGNAPFYARSGGSIPVVVAYRQLLDVPVVMMGFGLPDDNLHAPNEKITVEMFHRGVQTMLHFYTEMAQIK